ncbi:PH domain-containing protein [Flavobacterium daejeonense]|uniref:PH domain-containing protein n=1 Tax=Flavobacterium daejeonense TaxID=350893 RepID=UPI000478D3AE|nr:PH domain-containing protein [Flavobacterium daejeonense]
MKNNNTGIILKPTNLYAIAVVSKYLVLALLALILAIIFFNGLIFVSLGFTAYMWYKFLSIISINYIISEETIVVRTGILSRTFNSLELYRVKDYVTKQSVIMRIFNVMTITLITMDETNPILKIEGIPFSNIDETIRGLVQQNRRNNRIFETI